MISLKKNHPFVCAYADQFEDYLQWRSISLSESTIKTERWYLELLDNYLSKYNINEQSLTNTRLEKWLEHRPGEKENTRKKRLDFTKRLCLYIQKTDSSVEIPFMTIRDIQTDYIPYIFTKDEIKLIFDAADNYKSTIRSPYLHLSVPIAFRILYGCGLRSRELVSLKLGDVDTEANLLYIHDTKFGKSRYVPLSVSLSRRIKDYIDERFAQTDDDMFLLSSMDDNHPYTTETVHSWLMNLLIAAGIRHGGRGIGPRVHDLRHTFAVHSMQNAFAQGRDLMTFLPLLSTYLGHKDLRGTQYYLKLTAEVYPEILTAIENKYGKVIGDCNEK